MPSSHQDKISRRTFLAGGAATAALTVAACNNRTTEEPAAPPPHNTDAPMPNAALKTLRDLGNVRGLHFIDSDGNKVNLAGLQAQIGNNYSTMSFMFSACGDTCPMTGAALGNVSRNHPALKHVIISVQPDNDFPNRNMENLMRLQGLETRGPHRNTFILYPTIDGTASARGLQNGSVKSYMLQNEFELMTHGKDPEKHNATVTLFDPQGQMLAQVLEGAGTIVETLESHLPAATKAR